MFEQMIQKRWILIFDSDKKNVVFGLFLDTSTSQFCHTYYLLFCFFCFKENPIRQRQMQEEEKGEKIYITK